MENNLYYTPEISEFYIGFEYEHLTGFEKEFQPYIYDLAKACLVIERESISHNGEIVKMFIPAIQACIEEKQCRVKYLDQSDIESLGWKLYSQELTNRSNWCCFRNTQLELYVQLNNNYFPRLLSFKSRGGDHTGNFKIEIKNKSELKKLMQQLNIK